MGNETFPFWNVMIRFWQCAPALVSICLANLSATSAEPDEFAEAMFGNMRCSVVFVGRISSYCGGVWKSYASASRTGSVPACPAE
jgi:hypothetical protein